MLKPPLKIKTNPMISRSTLEFNRRTHYITSIFLLYFLICQHRLAGQCSVTSSLAGSSFSNNTSIGSHAWSPAGNITLSDNLRTGNGVLLGVLGSANTNYLVLQNFGFSIPSSAAICGIEVTIERRVTGLLIGSSVEDNSIRLVKNNIISGTNMASTANWPGSDGNRLYGNVSESWGVAWTPADINANNFGIAISAKLSAGLASLFLTAEIDQVTIKVFFKIV
jgi:hypothetical protein